MQKLKKLDSRLVCHRKRLLNAVGLTADEASKVATLVATEVHLLSEEAKAKIKSSSPVQISTRIDELMVFQAGMDLAIKGPRHPTNIRIEAIVQNYICFIYLKDACFEVILKQAPAKSVAARCAKYLSRGSVRDFRNAFAHANWQYNSTYTGLDCWLRKASKLSGPHKQFYVSQDDLDFWWALSRAVAYATYMQLVG